ESFGGLALKLPVLAFFMFVLTFSSIGLPGLNGFAGEFLVLVGMFQRAWHVGGWEWGFAVAGTLGVVLGAWYMLTLVGRVFFGALREPPSESVAARDGAAAGQAESSEDWHTYSVSAGQHGVRDLSLREVLALAPLVVFIVWIGIQPQFFLSRMTPALKSVQKPLAAPAAAQMADRSVVPEPHKSPGGDVPTDQLTPLAGSEEQLADAISGTGHVILDHPTDHDD
ncbi:MAG: hypothetical protein H5U01_04675, partial [Clostridia bacterium]|nr:hypothetical protein [Clostridia bacterium]